MLRGTTHIRGSPQGKGAQLKALSGPYP